MRLADFTENLSGQEIFQILSEAKKLEDKGKNILVIKTKILTNSNCQTLFP